MCCYYSVPSARATFRATSGFLRPRARQPSFSEIRELANKGRLYVTANDIVLLVRKPTKPPPPSRPRGRAACLLNDEPIRIYVPMLMRPWVMQLCHANVSCHFGADRTLRMLERFYWWIGMDICTKWWIRHCLRCQARKSSRQTVRWPILSLPLPSGPGVSVSVDYFGPLPTTPRGNAYILLFTDRFSRRADMYAAINIFLCGVVRRASFLTTGLSSVRSFRRQYTNSLECVKWLQAHTILMGTVVLNASTIPWHKC